MTLYPCLDDINVFGRNPLWVRSGRVQRKDPCSLRANSGRAFPERSLISDEHGRPGQDNPDLSELTEVRINLD